MRTDDIFSAIANPSRRQILELLRDNQLAAGDIASRFELNRPAISEHLHVLRSVDLVTEESRGRHRLYSLNPTGLLQVQNWVQPFEKYWQRRLVLLEEVLDNMEKLQ